MAKVNVEKIKEKQTAGANRERFPLLSIERNEDDYVYGVIKDFWFFEDKRFGGKRLGVVIDVFDGNGEVWDEDNNVSVHQNELNGTYTLFFRHAYIIKTFESKSSEIIDQPIIIYNEGKGDRGYIYKVIIGDSVTDFLE